MNTISDNQIMLVDDDPVVLEATEYLLREKGFSVHALRSGSDAIEKFQVHPVGIVLTDIRMPDMDGIEVLKKIKEIEPATEVIMLTAFASTKTAIRAVNLGASDYIVKPYDQCDLLNALQRAANKRKATEENRALLNDTVGKIKKMQSSKKALTEINAILDERLFYLTLLQKFNESIKNSRQYHELVEASMHFLSQVIDYAAGYLFTVQNKTGTIFLHKSISEQNINQFKEFTTESLAKILELSADTHSPPPHLLNPHLVQKTSQDPLKSFHHFSLTSRGNIIGLLTLSSFSKDAFSDDTINAISSIAGNLAFALDNAILSDQLVTAINVKTMRLDAINQVSTLLHSLTDLNKLLVLSLELILKTIGGTGGILYLKEKGRLVAKVEEALHASTIKTSSLLTTTNIHLSPAQDHFLPESQETTYAQFLEIPLLTEHRMYGAILVGFPTTKQLTEDDLSILKTLASLATTAIENAALYQTSLKQQEFEQELAIAKRIQANLLPRTIPHSETFHTAFISKPAREIGGDYIDFFQMEGGKLGMIIADVVGKGIPSSIIMTQLRSIMQTHIPMKSWPLDVLSTANDIILRDKLFDKFIPMFYCLFHEASGKLAYANAGHEPPLLFRQQTKQWETLDTDGLPMGASDDPSLEVQTITLEPNDILILYTDGVVEAKNNHGKRLGVSALQTILSTYADLSAPELAKKLLDSLLQFTQGEKQHDDISVILLKRAPRPAHLIEETQAWDEETQEIRVSSDPKMVRFVRAKVGELATQMGFRDQAILDIKLAVNEAQANAIEHGYDGKTDGEIVIQFKSFSDRLEISVIDFGKTPNLGFFKIPERPEELEGGGLGLFLMKTLMDDFSLNQLPYTFTECRLVKYIEGNEQEKRAL